MKPGTLINHRYEVVSTLGEGGMGTVYLVLDEAERNAPRALKLIRPGQLASANLVRYFKQEFESLAQLSHPNLAKVYDFSVLEDPAVDEAAEAALPPPGENGSEGRPGDAPPADGGAPAARYFFTSEYVDGTDLYKLAARIERRWDDLYEIVVQVLRALEYIHARGFIHHDVKPSNILVAEPAPGKYQVKLLDFGLVGQARKIDGIRGTIKYLAPEVAKGSYIDKRADLYSLGVTLYQVATRKLPFEGDTTISVIKKHLESVPESPKLTNEDLPDALEQIIMRLIAKEPADRYQSANEVIREINALAGKSFEIETRETRASYVLSGKFVGREREFTFLRECFNAIFRGDPQKASRIPDPSGREKVALPTMLLVGGESGIGKSRLVREFRYYVQLGGVHFVEGACFERGGAAYAPFPDIVAKVLRIAGGAEAAGAHLGELAKLLPELHAQGDIPVSEPLPPGEERIRLIETVGHFCLEVARRKPLAIVFEDLHWAQADSCDLLAALARNLQAAWRPDAPRRLVPPKLFLLGTYRSEDLAGLPIEEVLAELRNERLVHELLLKPLTAEEVEELVSSMLGRGIEGERLRRRLVDDTGGNPFFIEELMKALVEEGIFSFADGAFKTDDARFAVPGTVTDVLLRRLGRVTGGARTALDVLATLGKPASLDLVGAVAAADPRDLYPAIQDLEKRQILVRAARSDDVLFAFNNQTMRDLVYERLAPEARSRLHRRAGEALEAAARAGVACSAAELAHHFVRGGDDERAIGYALEAAEAARASYGNEEALNLYTLAIERLDAGGADRAKRKDDGRLVGAARARGEVALLVGKAALARDDFARVLDAARAGSDDSAVVRAMYDLARSQSALGKKEDAKKTLEEALRLAEGRGDREATGPILTELANVEFSQGRYDGALRLYDRSLDVQGEKGAPRSVAKTLRDKATCLFERGEYGRALEHIERAQRIDEATGNKAGLAVGLKEMSQVYYYLGDYDQAIRFAEQAKSANEAIGNASGVASSLNQMGHILHGRGKTEQAVRSYRDALDIWRRIDDKPGVAAILNNLGCIFEAQGHFRDAIRHYRDAASIFRTIGYKGAVALGLGNLAQSHLWLGDLETALSYCDRSLELSTQVGNQRIEVEGKRCKAEVLACRGRLRDARRAATEATEQSRAIANKYCECLSLLTLGPILERSGDLKGADGALERALDLALELGEKAMMACARLRRARLYFLGGHPWSAVENFEAGKDLAGELEDKKLDVEVAEVRSVLELEFGRFDKALAAIDLAADQAGTIEYGYRLGDIALERATILLAAVAAGAKLPGIDDPLEAAARAIADAEGLARDSGRPPLVAVARLAKARLHGMRKEFALAREPVDEALAILREAGERRDEVSALRTRGEILAGEDRVQEAAGAFEEALGLARDLGLGEVSLVVQGMLGGALTSAGRSEEAARLLRDALLGLRELLGEVQGGARATLLERPEFIAIERDSKRLLAREGARSTDEAAPANGGAREGAAASAPAGAPAAAVSPEEALYDRLTNLYNHHYFTRRLDEELKRSRRHGRHCALIKANIDGFKMVNEVHGPPVGREVVKGIAQVIRSSLRDIDIAARYFGDEFEILLPDTDPEGAMRIAERLRRRVEEAPIKADGRTIDLTLSLGVTAFPQDADDKETLICRVDEALYHAKTKGPNLVFRFEPQPGDAKAEKGALGEVSELLLSREGRTLVAMVNRLVNVEIELDTLANVVIGMIVEATNAERGFIMLLDRPAEKSPPAPSERGESRGREAAAAAAAAQAEKAAPGVLDLVAARNIVDEDLTKGDLKISRGIADEVAKSGTPILVAEAMEDERFRDFKSVMELKLRSILCAPIAVDGEVIGIVYVDHNSIARKFSPEDLNFLAAIAAKIAVPMKNSLRLRQKERELTLLQARLDAQQQTLKTKYAYDKIIGRSKPMQDVLRLLDRVIETDHPVVIYGESGTGKELIARAIHFNGVRKDKPFVAENCAALSETLLEAELFGHMKGAFTGADRDKAGLFELADGGTLFLDEIGDMSPDMQKKLLRVLQEGEIRRVGGKKVIKVDVRIVCASNKDLRKLIQEGQFRDDLYYRLSVITVNLPPLRDRKEDIPLLVDHFLKKVAPPDTGPIACEREVLRCLLEYDWPGNVRELENEIARMCAMADSTVAVEHLDPKIREKRIPKPSEVGVGSGAGILDGLEGKTLREIEEELSRRIILKTLEQTNWHRTQAAQILGLPTSTLYNKMKKLGIQ